MQKLFILASIFACTANIQAKTLRFPDPIRYEVNGQLLQTNLSLTYESLIKRFGKPISEDVGCVKTVDYPNASFIAYDEVVNNENERKFFVQSVSLQKPQDKIIFQSFVLNSDSTVSMVKKFNHRPVNVINGVSEYFFDIPETKKYDGYGYILHFKNQRLVKFEEWQNIC